MAIHAARWALVAAALLAGLAGPARAHADEEARKTGVLVIDGNASGDKEGDDYFHLSAFFAATGQYEPKRVKPAAAEKVDLRPYPLVVLLNVPELPAAFVKRVETHVKAGGGLVMFLGEKVKPAHYNVLFKAGLFPVTIGNEPHDPLLAPLADPDPELRKKERARLRKVQAHQKVWFPVPEHPAVSTVVKVRSIFRYLTLDVYWRAGLPKDDKGKANALVLVAVTRTGPAKPYKGRAEKLADDVVRETKALAKRVPALAPHARRAERLVRKVRGAVTKGAPELGEALDDLLHDLWAGEDKKELRMKDLWKEQALVKLRARASELRDAVLTGDPLVVARRTGKGRVVAALAPVGSARRRGAGGETTVAWHNWTVADPFVKQVHAAYLGGLIDFARGKDKQAPEKK